MYVVEQANKLAEVLEHVLGMKKCKQSLRKLGREGFQRQSQKTDNKKSQLWGHIATVPTYRQQKLFWLLSLLVLFSKKWVVGRWGTDASAARSVKTTKINQYFLPGLYMYIYIYICMYIYCMCVYYLINGTVSTLITNYDLYTRGLIIMLLLRNSWLYDVQGE